MLLLLFAFGLSKIKLYKLTDMEKKWFIERKSGRLFLSMSLQTLSAAKEAGYIERTMQLSKIEEYKLNHPDTTIVINDLEKYMQSVKAGAWEMGSQVDFFRDRAKVHFTWFEVYTTILNNQMDTNAKNADTDEDMAAAHLKNAIDELNERLITTIHYSDPKNRVDAKSIYSWISTWFTSDDFLKSFVKDDISQIVARQFTESYFHPRLGDLQDMLRTLADSVGAKDPNSKRPHEVADRLNLEADIINPLHK